MSLKNYQTMDVNLLLGLINTTLRNDCDSLDDLVKRYDLDESILTGRLESIGVRYYPELNQFRPA
ncbi:MAG: DUF4250 domain-containing protein [Verrucomicrobiales bacterium]|nr:DUF4250 domain-containing protein [Verrucomicrobiales bacterium]